MNLEVLSRKDIYIEGNKIRKSRLYFDDYVLHCRDVYIVKNKNIVIKIDQRDFRSFSPYSSDSENQCKLEISKWENFLPNEKQFFPEVISHGYFQEESYIVYWLAQPFYEKGKKNPKDHKDWGKLRKIFKKYDIEDNWDDDRNCFVDVFDRLICVDWAL